LDDHIEEKILKDELRKFNKELQSERFQQIDGYENNVLHILAYNNNPEIYQFLHANWKEDCLELEKCVNNQGMTPLQFAAYHGNKEILEQILALRRELLWKYVTVATYAYPLEEIDSMIEFSKVHKTEKKPKAEQKPEVVTNRRNTLRRQHSETNVKKPQKKSIREQFSVLEMIVYTPNFSVEGKRKRAKILQSPFIDQLLFDKWTNYAGFVFYLWMFFHAVYLIVLTTFTILGTDGLSVAAFWALEGFLVAFAIISIAFEISDIWKIGKFYRYSSINYHISCWVYSSLILTNFVLNFFNDAPSCDLSHYEKDPGNLPDICVASNVCLSLACFFSWYFFFYFARGFPGYGLFAVSMHAMIVFNMIPFAIVYFILIMAFTLALFPVWASDGWFYQFGVGMLTVLETSLFSTNFTAGDLMKSNPAPLVVIYFILTIFLIGILMVNMLIASMENTYEQMREEAKGQLFFEWTATCLEIERRVSFFFRIFKIYFDVGISLPNKPGVHFRVEEEERIIKKN